MKNSLSKVLLPLIAAALLMVSAAIILLFQSSTATALPRLNSMRIALSEDMLTDENIYKYHDTHLIQKMPVLISMQDQLPLYPDLEFPDPNGLTDEKLWKPNFSTVLSEPEGIIDLKEEYFLTDIFILDMNASPTLEIYTGEPFGFELKHSLPLTRYKTWRRIELYEATRFLKLRCYVDKGSTSDSSMGEIALYGYKTGAENQPQFKQPLKNKPETTASAAFGVNAFVDDPWRVSKVGGHIREFHNVSFTTSGLKSAFSPSSNGAWDFDAYYRSLAEKGIDVVPCIQGTTEAISGSNFAEFSGNEKPIPEGADPNDFNSYKIHAELMFNYAARYGKEKVDFSRLNLAAGQTPKSGLNYLTYYENFNEPNKDWEGEKSYLTPYQLAAMCSADYDGHEGRLGQNAGIKNADKTAKLVMGGLVGRSVVEYLNLMKIWFEYNRSDKLFAVDVVNVHIYQRSQFVEDTDTCEKISEIKRWIDENIPGTELWVTEFGPEIPLSEIPDRKSPAYYEAKANATVRTYMQGYAAGADRMTMFMLRDTDSGVYADDGLTTMKGEWSPKPSWHYTAALRLALKDTLFEEAVQAGENSFCYRFKNADKTVYAVWSKTAEAAKSITLKAEDAKTVHKTVLADSYAEGLSQVLPVGDVTLTPSPRPVFVTFYKEKGIKPAPTKKLINPISISGYPNTVKKIEVMFDEADVSPITPTARINGAFADYTKDEDYIASAPNNPENSLYPVWGILDLGAEYFITDVGYYDATSAGEIRVSAFINGSYVEVSSYGCGSYNFWTVLESKKVRARYLKVEKFTGAAVYEMAIYGYKP